MSNKDIKVKRIKINSQMNNFTNINTYSNSDKKDITNPNTMWCFKKIA